jgi:hypothetical protein
MPLTSELQEVCVFVLALQPSHLTAFWGAFFLFLYRLLSQGPLLDRFLLGLFLYIQLQKLSDSIPVSGFSWKHCASQFGRESMEMLSV